MQYQLHELAHLFPPMSEEEFLELKSDIKRNGLLESIVLYQGEIIDGRHRYKACEELGIEAEFEEYEGDAPAGYVVSKNMMRRNLNSSQKATVAVDMLPFFEEEAKIRMSLGGQGTQKIADLGEARQQVADAFGTNRQYVSDAKKLKEENPEAFDAVKRGEMNLHQVAKEARKKERKARILEEADGVKTDFERYEDLGWELPIYNIWNYGSKDTAFGQKHFGNIPPQVVSNLLYLYTKEGDLVYDPFVGGGMTLDVCKYFNRECLGYDLTPVRDDIMQHDIADGLPEIRQPKLIFLDPPYWQQAKEKYSDKETDLGNVDISDFYKTLDSLFANLEKFKGSTIALIIGMNKRDGKWIDLPFGVNQLMSKRFKFLNRVIVPYSTQVHGGAFVKQAQDKRELLYLYRDLLIYEL